MVHIKNILMEIDFLNPLYLRILGESDAVTEPTPGEAPAQVPTGAVLNEPSMSGAASSDPDSLEFSIDDFLQLYPDITKIDIHNPGELADYFASVYKDQQDQLAKEEDAKIVPSSAETGTAKEFI